jgi:hypothetical protein
MPFIILPRGNRMSPRRPFMVIAAVALLVTAPAFTHAQDAWTPGMISAGLSPGQRIKVVLRRPPDDSLDLRTYSDLDLDGALMGIDSGGLSLRLQDGTSRYIARSEGAEFRAHLGRSRGIGALGGLLLSAPISAVVCQGHKYECAEASVIGLGGMLIGALVGWDQWSDVHFPPQ